jgi:transposase-like protein
MERYSKIYKSKWQSQYSEEFKLKICREYLTGNEGIRSLEKKYKLGNSRLSFWLKAYGIAAKRTIYLPLELMPPKKKAIVNAADSSSAKLLKQQLEAALLEKELYRKMIEVAERDLKISIRKKSNTK